MHGQKNKKVKKNVKQIFINAKLQTGRSGQETADWEKSIKEGKVRTGLTVVSAMTKTTIDRSIVESTTAPAVHCAVF
jgi:hypothetical protein